MVTVSALLLAVKLKDGWRLGVGFWIDVSWGMDVAMDGATGGTNTGTLVVVAVVIVDTVVVTCSFPSDLDARSFASVPRLMASNRRLTLFCRFWSSI